MTESTGRSDTSNADEAIVAVHILEEPAPPADDADIEQLYEALTTGVEQHVEHWRVGVEVLRETYTKFLDAPSGALYAVRRHAGGKRQTVAVARALWEQARRAMDL